MIFSSLTFDNLLSYLSLIGNLCRGRESVDCSERGRQRGRGVDVEAGDEHQADQGGEGHRGKTSATEFFVATYNIISCSLPTQIDGPIACISTMAAVKDFNEQW